MRRTNQAPSSSYSEEAQLVIEEATRFTSNFLTPIMESMPHIYLSCLAFVPSTSSIPANLSHYPNLAKLKSGRKTTWTRHPMVYTNTGEGHLGRVTIVAYAPRGPLVALVSLDKTIRVWNHFTGTSTMLEKHNDTVRCIAFSPDAKQLVSGSDNGDLVLWDLETSLSVWDLKIASHTSGPLANHIHGVDSIAFSPLGSIFASGLRSSSIQFWNPVTGRQTGAQLEGYIGRIVSMSFSPDGNWLVSGDSIGSTRLWDVNHSSLLWSISIGSKVAHALFSPDASYIAVATKDQILRVDPTQGSVMSTLFCPPDSRVSSISFSMYGSGTSEAALCFKDCSIRFWDICSGLESGSRLYGHTGKVNTVSFSLGGDLIVSGSNDRTVRLWSRHHHVEQGAQPVEKHAHFVNAVTFSPDERHIASGSADCTVRIWNASDGRLVGKLDGAHKDHVQSVAYSPDGTQLATSSNDKTINIQLWDAKTLRPIGSPLLGHTDGVRSIAFSPDGTSLVSGSKDHRVGFWDLTISPPSVRFLEAHTDRVNSVSFSPQTRTFASASSDKTIILWDADSDAVGLMMMNKTAIQVNSGVSCVAYSPDGTKLAAGSNGRITVWDVKSRTLIGQPYTGHISNPILSVAFSPSGRYLASGSSDMSVCVWDVDQGSILGKPLHGHENWVKSVAFAPSGTRLVSGADDGTVRVWDIKHIDDRDTNVPPENVVLHDERQYPRSLFPEGSFDMSDVMTDEGWIVNAKRELLLWVPHEHRSGLVRPQYRILNGQPMTELDFEHYKYGTEWTQCYQAPQT